MTDYLEFEQVWNVRGLKGKEMELECELEGMWVRDEKVDIVFIIEANKESKTSKHIIAYTMIFSDVD